MITIGTLQLSPDPYVDFSYSYFSGNSSNNKIFGGQKTLTLRGSIVKATPAELIVEAKKIQDWYNRSPTRVYENITILGQTYPSLMVVGVNIPDGDWVNKIDYEIVLEAQIESSSTIPSNTFNLTYEDNVKNINISESISVNTENNGGTYYIANNGLQTIEGSVQWDIDISVTAKRSKRNTAIKNAELALRKIYSQLSSPDRNEFVGYKNWKLFLQTRALSAKAYEGSISLRASIVFVPPEIRHNCFVTLQSDFSHDYKANVHSKKVNIDIQGLVPILWTDLIDLQNSCSQSRMNSVNSLITSFLNAYRNESAIDTTSDIYLNAFNCSNYCTVSQQNICYSPTSFSVVRSIVEGKASLNLEWSSDPSRCSNNGITLEIEKQIAYIDNAIEEMNGWSLLQPVIQDLFCSNPMTVTYTTTATSRSKCINSFVEQEAINNAPTFVDEPGSWALIRNNLTLSNNQCTIVREFIRICP